MNTQHSGIRKLGTAAARVRSTAPKKKRGLAGMSIEKKREIASKSGKAVHARGKARTWTSEEARAAGHKGLISRRHAKETR